MMKLRLGTGVQVEREELGTKAVFAGNQSQTRT